MVEVKNLYGDGKASGKILVDNKIKIYTINNKKNIKRCFKEVLV